MTEELIQAVKQAMLPDLTDAQMEKLENVLYIQFHGKRVVEDKNELAPTGTDGDMAKINMFLGSKKTTGRKDGTLKQYSREIYSMLDFLGKRLEDITAMDLRYYYAVCRERNGIQMSTMQTRIHYLSSFWDFLTLEQLVPSNPVRRIGSLKVDSVIKKPYMSEELEALRLHCDRSRDRALIEFLLATGLRVSELCKLNVEDIDMYRMEFYVFGKGGKERLCLFDDVAKFHLKRYLRDRMRKERITEEEMQKRPLFVTVKAPYQRMTVAGVQYLLKELGRKAVVENVHPHRFRRTFATDMIGRGMKIEQVMKLMGHAKIEQL
ncbi:tyrosine-type recombinase/integrase [Clostridium sp. AM58-1XD]|uniref:tyrosine-type recombinase/integrase n=1 Tax=Clostridium sp. AM58-1XD TaxID=2292307 RepID=UPI001FA93CC5|nr:tyrosine-type recombinase/integrase [Clostridium sp. AM58-1XD]